MTMKITLSPVASNRITKVSLNGTVLTIDGQDVDLSVIPEGGYAEAEAGGPFVGNVTRHEATILYHYDTSKAALEQSSDWAHYTFDVTDGPVPCPIKWRA
jgi:hypothetical protein